MLRYKTEARPGLVALYDIRPGRSILTTRSPHRAQTAYLTIMKRRWYHTMSQICVLIISDCNS